MSDDFWDKLPALLLHDIQMGIIEAMLWIDDRPLSATDLMTVLADEESEGRLFLSKVAYHVKRLAKLDVLAHSHSHSHSRPRRGAQENFYEMNRSASEAKRVADAE